MYLFKVNIVPWFKYEVVSRPPRPRDTKNDNQLYYLKQTNNKFWEKLIFYT